MKVLIVHNKYAIPGRGSGEEVNIENISNLLRQNGHSVTTYYESSLDIETLFLGKVRMFFSGIYNFFQYSKFLRFLRSDRPDVVLIQNLYPKLSPAILDACRKSDLPVVMRVPNYRLVCPTGLMLRENKGCDTCLGGREYMCAVHNCEDNIFKSFGYALRGYIANKRGVFKDNVSCFLVLTQFAKDILVRAGYDSNKIRVLSGLSTSRAMLNVQSGSTSNDKFIGFVGRISQEKGIELLFQAAKLNPDIAFKCAGAFEVNSALLRDVPPNVKMLGHLNSEELTNFYSAASFLVVPSLCYEGLPSVCLEAMQFRKAVLCSDIGGLSEVVKNRETGLLFRPNSLSDLSDKLRELWINEKLTFQLGENAYTLGQDFYSERAFYERLVSGFQHGISVHNSRQPNFDHNRK